MVISRVPLTLQLSFFAKCVLFNICLYALTQPYLVNHVTIFCPNGNSILHFMKNDGTIPIWWKNSLFFFVSQEILNVFH